MLPTLTLGPIVLYTYTVLIDLGLVGALAWLYVRAPAHGRQPTRWLDAGLSAGAGAFLGGRVAFAAANWGYFQNHVFEIFKLWEGGYAWPGAVLGGMLGLFVYGYLRREPVPAILDELALPMLLIAALGWVGCAAASCAAGRSVEPDALPFAVNWPDLYGVVLPRWPTQLIGLALSLLAAAYLFTQRDRKWPGGFRFALALTLAAAIAFLVSTVRGDDMPLISGWRIDALANALMAVLGAIGLVATWALEPGQKSAATDAQRTENTESINHTP
jgi:phosphatidylglycerol---prolipoprotein diacylglyceryl transferase